MAIKILDMLWVIIFVIVLLLTAPFSAFIYIIILISMGTKIIQIEPMAKNMGKKWLFLLLYTITAVLFTIGFIYLCIRLNIPSGTPID